MANKIFHSAGQRVALMLADRTEPPDLFLNFENKTNNDDSSIYTHTRTYIHSIVIFCSDRFGEQGWTRIE